MPRSYDPNTSNEGGGNFLPRPGRKLLHAVGRRRWQSGNGTDIEDVEFVVLADLDRKDDDGDVGKRATGRFFLTSKALWRFGKFCLAVGQHEPIADLDDEEDMDRIVSLGAVVGVVDHDTYDGKTRAQVDEYGAFSGRWDPEWDDVIASAEEDYQEFRARVEAGEFQSGNKPRSGGGMSGGGGGGGRRSPSSGPSRRGGSDDSDIPFVCGCDAEPRWVRHLLPGG